MTIRLSLSYNFKWINYNYMKRVLYNPVGCETTPLRFSSPLLHSICVGGYALKSVLVQLGKCNYRFSMKAHLMSWARPPPLHATQSYNHGLNTIYIVCFFSLKTCMRFWMYIHLYFSSKTKKGKIVWKQNKKHKRKIRTSRPVPSWTVVQASYD